MSSSSSRTNLVPFFLLNLEGGKTKVLFTVPSNLALTLIRHPVLCRGAAFDLKLDEGYDQQEPDHPGEPSSTTCFLFTIFESPHPEATAGAISERLASRVTDSCENPLSTVFGF
ncbi:expressed unknown protein [Seminavis robusta]|uniref:Uncharacterized protein n=1 Tax=Seminavis robusta TaxID=568900 RepID=A0A9N8EU62_9STRA|nr:expressed unknown protein [Seminavis robusta]|eukprot:Sro1770_g296530.1 n/a (114) ;mRNA; f:5263-5604